MSNSILGIVTLLGEIQATNVVKVKAWELVYSGCIHLNIHNLFGGSVEYELMRDLLGILMLHTKRIELKGETICGTILTVANLRLPH